MAPFPHPAHRTGHADRPHPALVQDEHAFTHAKRAHEVCVWNAAEVVRQVGVHHFRVVAKQRVSHVGNRLLGVSALPVGVLLWWKIGFEDRVEHQHRCRHAHPITQGRDAQGPQLAIGLGNEHSSDRIRLVLLFPERKRQFPEPPLPAVRLDLREVLPIHARCALVGAAVDPGVSQDIVAVDLVVQRVEAEARL